MTSFRPGWDTVPGPIRAFYDDYVLNTLTTLRPDGRPHVVPVGVTLDTEWECAWVITRAGSRKVRNVEVGQARPEGARVAVCQVDGPRWSTIEGTARVVSDAESVARAVELYGRRYRQPSDNPERVALRIEVERILHGPALARQDAPAAER